MRQFQSAAILAAFACCALALASCGTELSSRISPSLPSPNAQAFAKELVGNYSNATQAKADSAIESLELHICPIWPDRIDGLWVYVESALTSAPGKPYRQRIYQIVDGNDASSVDSRMYEFPDDALKFAGAWAHQRPLEQLSPFLLIPRAGCTTTFHRAATGDWQGSMRPNECATDWKGAAYTLSEVTLQKNTLIAIDRGFDTSGTELWSSASAPIKFERVR